jgi:hypothetical protein
VCVPFTAGTLTSEESPVTFMSTPMRTVTWRVPEALVRGHDETAHCGRHAGGRQGRYDQGHGADRQPRRRRDDDEASARVHGELSAQQAEVQRRADLKAPGASSSTGQAERSLSATAEHVAGHDDRVLAGRSPLVPDPTRRGQP